ncbi:hypothetical protein GCM10009111_03780 [Colwellia asteriadis]|uniref:Uncharacterized protein n=1 Tax=Colwellia asteriadis TaxID=517723 RepID=A0ABN1L300_9GAMM
MINCSTKLHFLKSGLELEASVHDAIDKTIKLIFEHNNISQSIGPSQVTSKTNVRLCFYKYFHNHRKANRVKFNEEWCRELFAISLEENKDYSSLDTISLLLPAIKDEESVTKTLYNITKSNFRLFFYILWAQRAVLLPFDYKPPKARSTDSSKWIEIGLKIYPETLQLVRNVHFQDKRFEDLSNHLDTGKNFVKDFGYHCLIASTWYSIEDIDLDDIFSFKEFYINLRRKNASYEKKIKSLPFSSMLKGFLSYAPERCRFKLNDLIKIQLERQDKFNSELDGAELKVHKQFHFDVNLTNKLKFILTGNALDRAIAISLRHTFDVLLSRHYNNEVSMKTHGALRDFKTTRLGFIYVFKSVKPLNKSDLIHLYELLEHDYIAKQDFNQFISKEKDFGFWKVEYSDNFKSALKVFFLELYSAGAILLPFDFTPVNTQGKDYSEGRYPELFNIFLQHKQHLTSKDKERAQKVGLLYKAIIASSWRNVEDIQLSDALEYQRMHQQKKDVNQTKLTLALGDLLTLIYRYAPDRCNFKLNDIHLTLSEVPTASLIKKLDQGKMISQVGNEWITLTNRYINEKKATGIKSIRGLEGILGKLINHICIDLPRELGQESELIPNFPSQFKRKHFIGDQEIPSFKEKLRKSLGNESFNANLRAISLFFDWILLNNDGDISGFVNPISDLDFVRAPRRKGTNKKAFPRRQFSHIHSFTSAICEFYWYLISENRFVPGGVSSRHCYDTQEIGYVPLVLIDGRFQPIYYVPSNLTYEITSMKNGELYNYPTFQVLFENLIALETGLRHIHIRWLDREKFDLTHNQIPQSSNSHISELQVHYIAANESDKIEVSTDKVKTEPWKPYVSSRVHNLLRRLKAFQDTLDIEVPALWYDYHEGSIHGKIKSLFCSMDATKDSPNVIEDEPCRVQYKRLLFFYDLFIQLSGLDIQQLGTTSKKSLQKIEDARNLVKQERDANPKLSERRLTMLLWKYATKAAFYFNGQYKTDFKPHGTRASVASEKIKVLPPQAIQDYITGHESRAVLSYYIQVDPDWLKEVGDYNENILLSEQHLKSTTNRNLTDEQKARVKKNLQKVVEHDPTLLGNDFGAVGFTAENSKEDIVGGLKTIAMTPVSNCAFMPTHICPFGGVCPKEIKEEFGELQCGQCYFSVKTVDHIPRILAHIRKLNDELKEKTENIIQAHEAGADFEALDVKEQERNQIANEEAAWTYTYELLQINLANLKGRCADGTKEFLVARPDILMEYFVKGEVEDNIVNALLLRIQDANAFQEYFTPQLKAQITQIRNKILINQKKFDQLLEQPDGFELIDEFRGILRTFTEAQGISLKDATKLLSEPLRGPEGNIKLLEVING